MRSVAVDGKGNFGNAVGAQFCSDATYTGHPPIGIVPVEMEPGRTCTRMFYVSELTFIPKGVSRILSL